MSYNQLKLLEHPMMGTYQTSIASKRPIILEDHIILSRSKLFEPDRKGRMQNTDGMLTFLGFHIPTMLDMCWIYVGWIWNKNQIKDKCVFRAVQLWSFHVQQYPWICRILAATQATYTGTGGPLHLSNSIILSHTYLYSMSNIIGKKISSLVPGRSSLYSRFFTWGVPSSEGHGSWVRIDSLHSGSNRDASLVSF